MRHAYYCTDSNIEHAAERQALLEIHKAAYRKAGGKIKHIPPGIVAANYIDAEFVPSIKRKRKRGGIL